MSREKLTIALSDGQVDGAQHSADVNDSQDVTFTDGGALHDVTVSGFGDQPSHDPAAGPGGDDNFGLDLSQFDDDFTLHVEGLDSGDSVKVDNALSWNRHGDGYRIKYIGADGQQHDMKIELHSHHGSDDPDVQITCFAAGTLVETPDGAIRVEDLSVGDLVICGDGVARPVRWRSRRLLSAEDLQRHPEFRPVRIRRGAFGVDLPYSDLVVSPQHRILIDDWRAEMLFGTDKVLVPAIHLINDHDVIRDHDLKEVEYHHFMFDRHQIVISNGLESESFFPGETALAGVEDGAREELFRLFPDLARNPASYGRACCPILKAHEAMALLGA